MAARGGFAYCALALVSASGFTGCVDDGASLHVTCPIVPEIEDSICTYASDSDTCVLEGMMNVQATTSYSQVLAVESGLKPRARDVPPQAETNGIQMRTARVDLRTPDGKRIEFSGLPNPLTVTATGFVAPGGRNSIGVDIIQPAYWAQLRTGDGLETQPVVPKIVAAIKIRGVTSGDVEVEAGEFLWPIRLVSASPDPAFGECAMGVEYCSSRFGQDFFAVACF